MTLSVKLYGDLREKHHLKKKDVGIPSKLNMESEGFQTVIDILKQLNIDESEISHIFVNGIYSGPGKRIKKGDHVGIFPKRMGIMFLEITKIKSIYIKIILHGKLRKFGHYDAVVDMPEGSTINSVLKIYNMSNLREKIEIIINGKPVHDIDYILKDWDNVAIFPL